MEQMRLVLMVSRLRGVVGKAAAVAAAAVCGSPAELVGKLVVVAGCEMQRES